LLQPRDQRADLPDDERRCCGQYALHKRDEKVERSVSDLERDAILLEKSLGCVQAKRPEPCNSWRS
jgi:hypothetical protein